jgi:hypothetical protein
MNTPTKLPVADSTDIPTGERVAPLFRETSAKPNYEDIARRYVRFRAVSLDVNNAMVRVLSKEVFHQAGRQLGILKQGTLVFRDLDESAVLMDFAIHDCWVDGKNGLDRYLALHPPAPGSDQEAILAAKKRGWYSVFQVESVVPGVGVHVFDLIREQQHFLADKGFSTTAAEGVVLATRVFDFGDFLITGGAGLPVDADTLVRIARLSSLPENEDIAAMGPQRRAEFNATIIRLCLGARDAPGIRYQGIDEEERAPQAELQSRPPGRNETCPCGSGRKYKKCCGR